MSDVRSTRPDHPARTPRYELLVTIATGGMATVYVGRQHGAAGFERIVALKRMHPHIANDPSLVAMFRDEARIASLIHHPNVVTVHDMHEEAGELLLVMDYVDGVSLRQLRHARHVAGAMVPQPVALRIVVDTLRGLHAAHEQKDMDGAPLQVVHRDATPHNILVGADGSVKITDFGIARAAERSSSTMTGRVRGKFAYMSPEQCASKELDRRVDVFAMGVVLWELLTGSHLFHADNDAALVTQIVGGQYRRPSELRRGIPRQLEAAVMKALAVDPSGRFDTAGAFADAIERAAKGDGGTATLQQVGDVVMETCGEAVQARRHQLHEVMGGRRPKVTWAAPRSAPPSKGSQSYVHASALRSADSQAPPARSPHPSFAPPVRRPQRVSWIAAFAVTSVLVILLVFFFTRASSNASDAPAQASALASSASAAPPASAPSVADPGRVTVRIEADVEITEIRYPDGDDVLIQGSSGELSAPRGETPVAVHIRFKDGSVVQETVVPRSDTVIHVRKASKPSGGGPVVAAPPRVPAQPPPTAVAPTPTATPTPARTSATKTGPKYEKDPYQ